MSDKKKQPIEPTPPPAPETEVKKERPQAGNARAGRALKPKVASLDGHKEHDG
jgi:hypothetical protein